MNNQDLDNVLQTLNEDDCVKFFSGMTEKERKALSERALLWHSVAVGCNLDDPEMQWWNRGSLSFAPKRIQKLFAQQDEAKKLASQLPAEAKKAEAVKVTSIAVFATCGLTEVKKHEVLPNPDAVYKLLSDRKPRWTNQFAKYALEQRPKLYWAMFREMEKENEVALEHDSSYLAAMVLGLDRDDIFDILKNDSQLIDEALRVLDDHAALTAMLSQRGQWTAEGRFSFTGTVSHKWKKAFCRLVDEEMVPKNQVIKSVMSTITRLALENSDGSAALRPSWFTELHDDLQLELDEHLEVYPEYCTALRSRSDWSVRWAIERINLLNGFPDFPLEDACSALADVFLTKGKENSLKAIDCLKSIAKEHESLRPNVAMCAAEALSHSSPDIQKQAIMLIEKFGDKSNAELTDRLAQQMEYITVLNKERLAKWLPSSQATQVDSGVDSSSSSNVVSIGTASSARRKDDSTQSSDFSSKPSDASMQSAHDSNLDDQIASLKDSIQDIPENWLKVVGIQSGWDALNGALPDIDSVDFDGTEFPRLDDDNKLKPIQDLDELIFLVARHSQNLSSLEVDELELMIDGVSRLCSERPDDFAQRTASIQAFILNSFDVMKIVIEAWLDRKTNLARLFDTSIPGMGGIGHFGAGSSPIDRLFNSRCIVAANRISKGISMPLLAAPTHRGGWIDPTVLVERVLQGAHLPASELHREAEQEDQVQSNAVSASQTMLDSVKALSDMIPGFGAMFQSIQNHLQNAQNQASAPIQKAVLQIDGNITEQSVALLRLAPERRDEALRMLNKGNVKPCEFVEALRYALGANDVAVGSAAPLWVAAARSRAPFQDDAKVEGKFPGLGPDCGKSASYKLVLRKLLKHNYYGGLKVFDVEPESKPGEKSDIATLSMHYHEHGRSVYNHYAAWSATMWPMCLEPLFAIGAEHSANNMSTSDTSGTPKYLVPIYDPDIPAKHVAMLFIGLALTAKAKDENGAAIESLIQCIDDGRINGAKLGDTLYQLYSTKALKSDGNLLVTLQRWTKALRTVAQTSQYHARVVALALEQLLRGDPAEAPKDLHSVLELLLELLMQEQQVLSLESARDYLTGLKTSGKTAKLTKQLLALKPGALSHQKRQEAILYAIERRIDRVQRWQRRVEQVSVPV